MSITISNAVLHRVDKESESRGAGSVRVKPSKKTLNKDARLHKLCTSLLEIYSNHAHGNGTLGVDPSVHKFTPELRKYYNEENGFIDFSLSAIGLIKNEMEDEFRATGGYVLILRYQTSGMDFLMVVMLKMKESPSVDDETMELTESLNFDLTKLHEAARVNLTRWIANEQPHLTFIKGRGNERVTKYFRDALACTNYNSDKEHTDKLIEAADSFIDSNQNIPENERTTERLKMRENLYDCLTENKNIEIPLETVAARIYPADPQQFIDHVKSIAENEGLHIDAPFKPYPASVRKLKRIKANFGTINLSFDVGDVQARRVKYDEITETIVLENPPQNLIDRIKENDIPTE